MMGDHVVLDVERLTSSSEAIDSCYSVQQQIHSRALTAPHISDHVVVLPQDEYLKGYYPTESDYLLKESTEESSTMGSSGNVECRICQEEDQVGNLETPCACAGSVKYAHRKCVQRWCNEKGDTVCEICQQPYQHGYTAPPRPVQTDAVPVDLSGSWGITGPIDLRDPRILAMAAAERHFLETDYDEYSSANASSAACCRSAALILMALLLLRHALAMAAAGADDDTSTLFTLFLLRAAGFLLPCYIMLRALNILQRRRQRQEAAMAAAEVAILIQAGQARGVQFNQQYTTPTLATITTAIPNSTTSTITGV